MELGNRVKLSDHGRVDAKGNGAWFVLRVRLPLFCSAYFPLTIRHTLCANDTEIKFKKIDENMLSLKDPRMVFAVVRASIPPPIFFLSLIFDDFIFACGLASRNASRHAIDGIGTQQGTL